MQNYISFIQNGVLIVKNHFQYGKVFKKIPTFLLYLKIIGLKICDPSKGEIGNKLKTANARLLI